MVDMSPDVVPGGSPDELKMKGGRKTRGATTKALKKMLKKAGLKTTGRKAALTRRAKKAHLKIRGGEHGAVMEGEKKLPETPAMGARRRKSRGKLGVFGL